MTDRRNGSDQQARKESSRVASTSKRAAAGPQHSKGEAHNSTNGQPRDHSRLSTPSRSRAPYDAESGVKGTLLSTPPPRYGSLAGSSDGPSPSPKNSFKPIANSERASAKPSCSPDRIFVWGPVLYSPGLSFRPEHDQSGAKKAMLVAQNLRWVKSADTYLIHYSVKVPLGNQRSGLGGIQDASPRKLIESFASEKGDSNWIGVMSDYKMHLVMFFRSKSIDLGSSAAYGRLQLEKRQVIQWRDVLEFLHSAKQSDPHRETILKLFNAFLRQPRSPSETCTTKAGFAPVLQITANQSGQPETSSKSVQTVAGLIKKFLKDDPDNLRGLEAYLKGLRVQVQQRQSTDARACYNGRKTITGLARCEDGFNSKSPFRPEVDNYGGDSNHVRFYSNPKPRNHAQALEELGKPLPRYVSVTKYFEKCRGTVLDSKLPLDNVGTRSKPIYIPSELCILRDGPRKSSTEISYNGMASLIGTATVPKWVNNLTGNRATRYPGLKLPLAIDRNGCEVSMMAKSLLVPCRSKGPPSMEYVGRNVVKTVSGTWNTHTLKLSTKPRSLKAAVLMVGSSRWTGSEVLIERPGPLCEGLKRHGIVFDKASPSPRHVPMRHRKFTNEVRKQIRTELESLALQSDVTFIVLPLEIRSLYEYIKSLCDKTYGIQNVCAIAPKIADNNGGYFFHLALKANLKTGGRNQVLRAPPKVINLSRTVIIGIDTVMRPKKLTADAKSVAAMVISSDSTLSRWPSAFQVFEEQPLPELSALLKYRLQDWEAKYHSKPEAVIIYHNGLAKEAYREETESLREACGTKMTLIAVSTDHQAKLEPLRCSDKANEHESSASTATFVRSHDEDRAWEFIHQGCNPKKAGKGSARGLKEKRSLPIRYSVVYDGIFSPNGAKEALEDLTDDMCYLSGCSTSALANTLPIYYVGLLCKRIRSYIRPWYHPNETSKTNTSNELTGHEGSKKKDESGQPMTQKSIEVKESLRDTMFYI